MTPSSSSGVQAGAVDPATAVPVPIPDAQLNRQRVAPYGSAVATPNAVTGVTAKRSHGADPALGALYGAVRAPSRADAGQPSAA